MDGLTLLWRAREAGLRVEAAAGDKLLIRGPKCAVSVVKLLAEHKAEVLEALAANAMLGNLLSADPASPWCERTVPPVDGEPGLEQPCLARRGRIVVQDGLFLHFCIECGRFGAFGYGVHLGAGKLGRWYCAEHRPANGSGALVTRNDG